MNKVDPVFYIQKLLYNDFFLIPLYTDANFKKQILPRVDKRFKRVHFNVFLYGWPVQGTRMVGFIFLSVNKWLAEQCKMKTSKILNNENFAQTHGVNGV